MAGATAVSDVVVEVRDGHSMFALRPFLLSAGALRQHVRLWRVDQAGGQARVVLWTAVYRGRHLRGGGGGGSHGHRLVSYLTTQPSIQLDAIGGLALDAALHGCIRDQSVHSLSCTLVEQWSAKLMPPELSHPLFLSSL